MKESSGLLMYKIVDGKLNVFLVHPGGPFWKDKDKGAWSIPKGEADDFDEGSLFATAIREFEEETGIFCPKEKQKYFDLGNIKQKSSKIVHAWAFEGDWTGLLICKSFVEMDFHGKKLKFPEVDRAGFFNIDKAKEKINSAQFELVERLREKIKYS